MRTAVDRLIINASELVTGRSADGRPRRGAELDELDVVLDGALALADGRIVAVGSTNDVLRSYDAESVVDARGRLISPGFVDPHTHLISGGSRALDWEERATARARPDIAGGIGVTVAATRSTETDILQARALADLDDMLANGTTFAEAKTGYGLNQEQELRQLQILSSLQHPVTVAPTYLGAHMVPADRFDDRSAYVREVIRTLPQAREYTDRCDIACDPVSFTRAESEQIATAATELGFSIRVHADQTGDADGTRFAVSVGAMTAEHLDRTSDAGLDALAASATVGVLFPGATYHLTEMTPKPSEQAPPRDFVQWASRLVDSGAALALSTDFNPGTSPTTSMPATMRLAMRLYRLSYAQVWNMATLNAAAALGVHGDRGVLQEGSVADLVIWNAESHQAALHRFGSNLVNSTIVAGERRYANSLERIVFSDAAGSALNW